MNLGPEGRYVCSDMRGGQCRAWEFNEWKFDPPPACPSCHKPMVFCEGGVSKQAPSGTRLDVPKREPRKRLSASVADLGRAAVDSDVAFSVMVVMLIIAIAGLAFKVVQTTEPPTGTLNLEQRIQALEAREAAREGR